jgi:hypothetical protein
LRYIFLFFALKMKHEIIIIKNIFMISLDKFCFPTFLHFRLYFWVF